MMLGPITDATKFASTLATLFGVCAGVWAFVRFILRPLFDETVFNAVKRKGPDVEKYLRSIFADDIEELKMMKDAVAGAVNVADANARTLAGMVRDQGQMMQLLGSIPHLAGTMEGFSEQIERMYKEQRETNRLVQSHAERIAAHAVMLREDDSERRHTSRRLGDPPPPDDGVVDVARRANDRNDGSGV